MSNNPSDDDILDAALESLPSEIQPQRDLWPDITQRIRVEAPARPSTDEGANPRDQRVANAPWWHRFRLPALVPVFAAAAVLATILFPRDEPAVIDTPAGEGLVAAPVAPASTSENGAPDLEAALAAYKVASNDLMAAFAAHKKQLDPETRAVFEDHLSQIKRALDDLDEARAKNPNDPSLVGFVLDVQRQRVALLERALLLSQPS